MGDDPRTLVNRQAEDEGLWFDAVTAPEAYLQQELRRLHAAVEAVGWQPISTAPRDGRQILLGRYVDGVPVWVFSDRWHEDAGCWVDAPETFPPTHWMLLPAPPKPSPEERRTG